jgi:hypothetical protein
MIHVFNFSIPLLFCVFSYLWKEIFHEGNGKHVGINIPMYEGGFKQVQYEEYICWMQVKIYISDQTSLRICNSVEPNKTIARNEWASFNLYSLRKDSSYKNVRLAVLSPNFKIFKEPKNRFQGANSPRLCSLARRYDNHIPTRFLAPIDCLKIPTLYLPPLCQWWL